MISSVDSKHVYTTDSGIRVTPFRGGSFAPETLNPDNWDPAQSQPHMSHGNFRFVHWIYELENGERLLDLEGGKGGLYVKSAERCFTLDVDKIREGDFWWEGPQSGCKYLFVPDEPTVEDMVECEAAILLRLRELGVKAEEPQALLDYPDGKRAFIARGIPHGYASSSPSDGRAIDKVKSLRDEEGWKPVDFAAHNWYRDRENVFHVIDVNRWVVPGITERFHDRLKALLLSRLESEVAPP